MDLSPLLGANWRTTLTAVLSAATGLLTVLAAAPYELGAVAEIIPPEHKALIFKIGAVATFLLRVINGAMTKDAKVSGTGAVDDPQRTIDKDTGGSKFLGLLLLAFFALNLTACATVYEDGKPVFRISANATDVRYQSPAGSIFQASKIDPAAVHRTIGSNIGSGATAVGAAIATSGLIR